MPRPKTTPRKLIRLARLARGMRQEDLALAAGCSQERVSRIERGVISPTNAEAQRVGAVLGVSAELLFPAVRR